MADELIEDTVTPEPDMPETPVVAPVTPVTVPAAVPVPPVTLAPVAPVTPAEPSEPAFTQEQLNKVTGAARKEGREAAIKELMRELGVTDKSAIKAAIDADKARRDAELSELDRFRAQVAEAEAARLAAEQNAQAIEQRAKAAMLKHELEKQATALNFNDVEDLRQFLKSDDIVIDLETQSVTGVAEQAKAIAKAKPYLIRQPEPVAPVVAPPAPAPNVPASPKPNQPNTADLQDVARKKAWKPSF